MHILVLGGAGMVGRKFIERLAREGALGGKAVTRVTAQDVVPAAAPPAAPFDFEAVVSDLSLAGEPEKLIATRPEVIVHLAAIVSGEAEAEFEKGYRINLDGTRALFEAIRLTEGYTPRLVFTSSVAVFGAPFHDKIEDEFFTTPLTSYGTQKAIGELLLCDYSRRGFFDGVAIRLPTICVRPGKPNKAASGFFSNIIREPLNGEEAVLPVSDQVRHWHASPRSAVGFLFHAATMDTAAIGPRRALTMPGYSCTVAEQIETLRKVAGENVVKRIRRETDPVIDGIVAGWPRNFDPQRALALGFKAESSFEEIIRVHIEDELHGTFVK
ncbi:MULTISPECIES: D-erythronate dehydrogenase [unclassified Bosea (in: a-proteobacteria)]|uniref:D-erythronate dehydrogenase n=1 Tax=unclassified Bosea (in: a-proteobacteria) TaxID=2653178 RepID=UPI0009565D75|nr:MULTISPECIES: D-erythronate dehydrogenase [unclassified Bosea (in: a-proteobacteria)]TAJ29749.1 MAG: SDR family oxidoreductase [Bosea sp. (in: a-proteobacteria)]SIQ59383.1 Nucleoside-diphosphate-sugar epimerase [Bosea sp. TND4EK4]